MTPAFEGQSFVSIAAQLVNVGTEYELSHYVLCRGVFSGLYAENAILVSSRVGNGDSGKQFEFLHVRNLLEIRATLELIFWSCSALCEKGLDHGGTHKCVLQIVLFEADKVIERSEFDWNIEPVTLCQSWYG